MKLLKYEVFKDITEYADIHNECKYSISNMGRVYNKKLDKILKPIPTKRTKHYRKRTQTAKLNYGINSIQVNVNQLVLKYFGPKDLVIKEIIHKDNDKSNCEYVNLIIVSM